MPTADHFHFGACTVSWGIDKEPRQCMPIYHCRKTASLDHGFIEAHNGQPFFVKVSLSAISSESEVRVLCDGELVSAWAAEPGQSHTLSRKILDDGRAYPLVFEECALE
jgi:hypothetical protein